MRNSKVFYINGERKELCLFEKGDRVMPTKSSTTAIGAEGTVSDTKGGGLFIDVIWDETVYPSTTGGNVALGGGWMINALILI